MKAPFYSITPKGLHDSIKNHVATKVVQTASFDESTGCYRYSRAGTMVSCGGLLSALRAKYYSHYRDNRSKRCFKKTGIRGSSTAQGKSTDKQLGEFTRIGKVKRPNKYTKQLLAYWENLKHAPQAAQLPVELPGMGGNGRLTQADLITSDPDGRLWLYEVKSGCPVGFYHSQDNFGAELADVKCTKLNIWHLQLQYTRMALERAGIPIYQSRVIQVYNDVRNKFTIKVHEPEAWVGRVTPLASSVLYTPKVYSK